MGEESQDSGGGAPSSTEGPAGRERRIAVVAVAAVLAALSGITWSIRQERAPSAGAAPACADGRAALRGAWGPERRRSVVEALGALEVRYAADVSGRAVAGLDRYVDAWVDAGDTLCATRRGGIEPRVDAAAQACLDGRRLAVDALVERLVKADRTVAERAVAAVEGLPRLDLCARLELLPVVDGAASPTLEAARRDLVRERAALSVGDTSGCDAIAAAADDDGRLADGSYAAELVDVHGRCLEAQGDPQGAAEALAEAVVAAVASGRDALAIDASARLIAIVGGRLRRAREAQARLDLLRALVLRRGGVAREEAWLARAEGIVARASGREAAARDALRAALARLSELDRGGGVEAASLLLEIGRSEAALGDTEAAVAAIERSLAVARAALGERHPAVAVRLSALASVKIRRRELEPAFALVLEARSILEAAYGLEHPEIAEAMIYEAQILKHEGELERAEGALARALAIDEELIGEAPGTAAVLLELVQLHLERVEPEHARPLLERARPIIADAFGEDSYEYAGVLRREAWASLQEGDHAGAAATLRRAVELLERPGSPPLEELAEARWHLAYARAEGGASRAEVDALARQALAEFERAGPVFFRPRAAIERWLARD